MRWNPEVIKTLDTVKSLRAPRKAAVFDVDGTLWYNDIGESFFKYQIANGLAPGLQGIKDPLLMYRRMELTNRADAYIWLAQINGGMTESQLRIQVYEFLRQHFDSPVQPEMRQLIEELKNLNFEVWLCSGSIRWTLEPLVKQLGLKPENLIATETRVDGEGRLTKEPVLPIPYAGGKKAAIEQRLGFAPQLVAGNSMGDFDMMTLAQTALAVNFIPHLREIEASEKELQRLAQERGWAIQLFQQ